ncbi:hypothetical protein [Nocardia farcinica]|uniref:hypothetical protein n=1 Tax=Nocardia farcinica TaxID=37329 RepID=UPI00313AD00D
METRTVHTAVYDTLADWEVGAAIAHINNPEWQRNPGSFEVRTVGLTRDPIRTKGGVRIVPDLALGELTPEQRGRGEHPPRPPRGLRRRPAPPPWAQIPRSPWGRRGAVPPRPSARG